MGSSDVVNDDKGTGPVEAERALAISYAAADCRAGLEALLALDRTLGGILRTTREPLVGQVRLLWWRDALTALDSKPAPAEPVLAALGADVIPRGVTGVSLAGMVDGWEALLEAPLDHAAVARHAAARGRALFGAAAALLGTTDPRAETAGEGWALADVAANLSDPALAMAARQQAREKLAAALDGAWPRALRALGALAWLARLDVEGATPGRPGRVWRLLRFRLTGR